MTSETKFTQLKTINDRRLQKEELALSKSKAYLITIENQYHQAIKNTKKSIGQLNDKKYLFSHESIGKPLESHFLTKVVDDESKCNKSIDKAIVKEKGVLKTLNESQKHLQEQRIRYKNQQIKIEKIKYLIENGE